MNQLTVVYSKLMENILNLEDSVVHNMLQEKSHDTSLAASNSTPLLILLPIKERLYLQCIQNQKKIKIRNIHWWHKKLYEWPHDAIWQQISSDCVIHCSPPGLSSSGVMDPNAKTNLT
jgi:hypothetical protein